MLSYVVKLVAYMVPMCPIPSPLSVAWSLSRNSALDCRFAPLSATSTTTVARSRLNSGAYVAMWMMNAMNAVTSHTAAIFWISFCGAPAARQK